MRPLGADRGVVRVAGVDGGVVGVDVEDPAGDVTEELFETAWLPSLSDTARKPKVIFGGNNPEEAISVPVALEKRKVPTALACSR